MRPIYGPKTRVSSLVKKNYFLELLTKELTKTNDDDDDEVI